jgi:AcrR family transcriptional regulator
MPRLARRVGLTPMALYRYVPGKDALVDLMVDVAIGDPPGPGRTGAGWRQGLREWAGQAQAGFRRHPWLIEATARQRLMGPGELGWLDRAVGLLDGTGLTGPERLDAVLVLLGHVRSMAQYAASRAHGGMAAGDWNAATVRLVNQHSDRYPALRSAVEDGALSPDDRNGLEFGIQRVLDGIEVLIASRANAGN